MVQNLSRFLLYFLALILFFQGAFGQLVITWPDSGSSYDAFAVSNLPDELVKIQVSISFPQPLEFAPGGAWQECFFHTTGDSAAKVPNPTAVETTSVPPPTPDWSVVPQVISMKEFTPILDSSRFAGLTLRCSIATMAPAFFSISVTERLTNGEPSPTEIKAYGLTGGPRGEEFPYYPFARFLDVSTAPFDQTPDLTMFKDTWSFHPNLVFAHKTDADGLIAWNRDLLLETADYKTAVATAENQPNNLNSFHIWLNDASPRYRSMSVSTPDPKPQTRIQAYYGPSIGPSPIPIHVPYQKAFDSVPLVLDPVPTVGIHHVQLTEVNFWPSEYPVPPMSYFGDNSSHLFTFIMNRPPNGITSGKLSLAPNRSFAGHFFFLACDNNVVITFSNAETMGRAIYRNTMDFVWNDQNVESRIFVCWGVFSPARSVLLSRPVPYNKLAQFYDFEVNIGYSTGTTGTEMAWSAAGPTPSLVYPSPPAAYTTARIESLTYATSSSVSWRMQVQTPATTATNTDLPLKLVFPATFPLDLNSLTVSASATSLQTQAVIATDKVVLDLEKRSVSVDWNVPTTLLYNVQIIFNFQTTFTPRDVSNGNTSQDSIFLIENKTQPATVQDSFEAHQTNIKLGDVFTSTLLTAFPHSPLLTVSTDKFLRPSTTELFSILKVRLAAQPIPANPSPASIFTKSKDTILFPNTSLTITVGVTSSPVAVPVVVDNAQWQFSSTIKVTKGEELTGNAAREWLITFTGPAQSLTLDPLNPILIELRIPISTADVSDANVIDFEAYINRDALTDANKTNLGQHQLKVNPNLYNTDLPTIPTTDPYVCEQCEEGTTKQCHPFETSTKVCECKDGFKGQTCADISPSQCESKTKSLCAAAHTGYVVLDANQCGVACSCYNQWSGPKCGKCSLECKNNGVPFSDCFRCGCRSGYSGNACECQSVIGTIMLEGTNSIVVETKGLLSTTGSPLEMTHHLATIDVSKNYPLPTKSTINDEKLYALLRELYPDLVAQLTQTSASGQISFTVSQPSQTVTKFTFTIVYGCPSSYPEWDSVQKVNSAWKQFTDSFPSLEIIRLRFPGATVGNDGTTFEPTPPTLPGDDDKAIEYRGNSAFGQSVAGLALIVLAVCASFF